MIVPQEQAAILTLGPGIALLPGRAGAEIGEAARALLQAAPPRRMVTPGGKPMSVAMTNCGALGWVSDRRGYRYAPLDPLTAQPWPAMPQGFAQLAEAAAEAAGFPRFQPDACLVNLYAPDSRMGLHQDRDEQDFSQPIVSVSLGQPALFRIGGTARRDPTRSIRLDHGDIIIFGGPARLIYHGIDRLLAGPAHGLDGQRINLTFRRAG